MVPAAQGGNSGRPEKCEECRSTNLVYEGAIALIVCEDCGLTIDWVEPGNEPSPVIEKKEGSPASSPGRKKPAKTRLERLDEKYRTWDHNAANTRERSWKPRLKQIRFIGSIEVPFDQSNLLKDCRALYKALEKFNRSRDDNSLKKKRGTDMKIAVDAEVFHDEESTQSSSIQQRREEGRRRQTRKNSVQVTKMEEVLVLRSELGTSPQGIFLKKGKGHLMLNYICSLNRSINRLYTDESAKTDGSNGYDRDKLVDRSRELFNRHWVVALSVLSVGEIGDDVRDGFFSLLVALQNYPLFSEKQQRAYHFELLYVYFKKVRKCKITRKTLFDGICEHLNYTTVPNRNQAAESAAKQIVELRGDD